jgi:hypothetical protein
MLRRTPLVTDLVAAFVLAQCRRAAQRSWAGPRLTEGGLVMDARGVTLAVFAVALPISVACTGMQDSPGSTSGAVAGADLALASPRVPGCGPAVTMRGRSLLVAPSGGDDTKALQCALDAAIASGLPATVQLGAGTFHTAQLVAKGFMGHLRGAGKARTTVTKIPGPLPVTAVDFYTEEPSASNPYPSLIAFVNGDFTVSDLTIQVLDPEPTTGWSIFGLPTIKALAHEILVVGTSAHATVERVAFVGTNTTLDWLYGNNIYNAAFYEGFLADLVPIGGAFLVRDCDFIEVAAGAVVYNTRNARIFVGDSSAVRTQWPVQLIDMEHTAVVVAGNRFEDASAGIQLYDNCLGQKSACGLTGTSLVFAGNSLSGLDGIEILSTFNSGVHCTVVGNDIQYDAAKGGVAVWLGPGTKGCFVATAGAVKNEGTGNRIVTLP